MGRMGRGSGEGESWTEGKVEMVDFFCGVKCSGSAKWGRGSGIEKQFAAQGRGFDGYKLSSSPPPLSCFDS